MVKLKCVWEGVLVKYTKGTLHQPIHQAYISKIHQALLWSKTSFLDLKIHSFCDFTEFLRIKKNIHLSFKALFDFTKFLSFSENRIALISRNFSWTTSKESFKEFFNFTKFSYNKKMMLKFQNTYRYFDLTYFLQNKKCRLDIQSIL